MLVEEKVKFRSHPPSECAHSHSDRGLVWDVFGSVWGMFGGCLGVCLGKCMGDVSKVFGLCLGGGGDVCGNFRNTLRALRVHFGCTLGALWG